MIDTTPVIDINSPVWNGGNRCVGINTQRVVDSQMYKIRILHKRVDGTRSYPDDFYMRGRDIRSYEAKPLKKYPNIFLHWVPINDLSIELPNKDICLEHNAIRLADGRCVEHVRVTTVK